MEADEPWQALACCMEIARAVRAPDPAAHISHFPVHQVSWGPCSVGPVLQDTGYSAGVPVWGPVPVGPVGLAM